MAFKLGALLIVFAQIYTTMALPPCVCARNLLPVCGSDGVTYSNQCVLECAAITKNKEITRVAFGPCNTPTPNTCVCNLSYTPVCGSDGQTYGNECGLNCHKSRFNEQLTVQHLGPCKSLPGPVPVCPAIDSPVCGSDGNTYGNDCFLNSATSYNPGLRYAHNGPCGDRINVVDV